MPHPLPDDVNSVTGLKWFLAAVPDDPAFTRAAWDVFTEMGNYWKWGKEGPVPGDSDKAAQLWTNAIYETIEAYKMGFPQLLLDAIDNIEPLLEAIRDRPCCESGENVVTDNDGGYIPGDDVGGDVERDVGDPPGDSETWQDWELALCANAAEFVDSLSTWVSNIENFRSWVSAGVITLTGAAVGLVLAQAAAVGIIGTTLAGIVGGGVAALSFLDDLRDFFDTTEPNDAAALAELETTGIINGLICAITQSDTPAEAEAAMDAYLTANAPNAAGYITALPMRWFMNKAFSDEIDGSGFGGPCPDCGLDYSFFHLSDQSTIATTNNGWALVNMSRSEGGSGSGACEGVWRYNIDPDGSMGLSVHEAATRAGYTLPGSFTAYIERVELEFCNYYDAVKLTVIHPTATNDVVEYDAADGLGPFQYDPPGAANTVVNTIGSNAISLTRADGASSGGSLSYIKVYFRIEAA